MKTFLYRLAVVAAGTVVALGAVPAVAQAATATITVDDATDNEGFLHCSDGVVDSPCGTITANQLRFYVRISGGPNAAVTVGWRLVAGTASAGSDYSGPTTGTVTIPKGIPGTSFTVPLVFDGFNESTEQFTVQLTSSSTPANISDTGTGTIRDGTQIPGDCTPSILSEGVMALDCTARPAGQQWRLQTLCLPFGRPITHLGNTVTGNGRSTVDCSGAPITAPFFRLV